MTNVLSERLSRRGDDVAAHDTQFGRPPILPLTRGIVQHARKLRGNQNAQIFVRGFSRDLAWCKNLHVSRPLKNDGFPVRAAR